VPVVAALRDACNEALTNAAKHAGVTRVDVRVDAVRERVRITIRDAGVGFDPATEAGFGTTESITRRLAEVGGRAEIERARDAGTTVVLWSAT
jgi:signal transduction histidine kinase